MNTIFYIIMGALASISIMFLLNKNKSKKIGPRGWIFSIISLFLIFFGLAWAQISIHENEIQAAVVGLILFGGVGLVFSLLSLRHIGITIHKTSDNNKEGVSIKSLSIGVLIIFSSLLLFFALFFNKAGTILSNSEAMSDFVNEQLIADDVLPQTIKKAVVYKLLYDSDSLLLDQRILIGIMGSIDEQEWIELFNLFAPEETRFKLVDSAVTAINKWLESDIAYPELEIAPQAFTNKIKNNAEEIILWIYRATLFPACNDTILQKYDNDIFSSNLQDLISCKPPIEYRELIAPHGAIALKTQIDSANVPALISLKDKIAETMSAEQMTVQKIEVKKMRSVLSYIFILPLLLLLFGISLPFILKVSWKRSLAWPAIISGVTGLLLGNYFSNSQKVFAGFVDNIAETVPAPALAIIQKLMAGVIDKTLPVIYLISAVLLIVGIILLIMSNMSKLKLIIKNIF